MKSSLVRLIFTSVTFFYLAFPNIGFATAVQFKFGLATGITDLNFNGQTLNIKFAFTRASSSTLFPTLGDSLASEALVGSINDALNSFGATGILPAGVGAKDVSYIVPDEIISSSVGPLVKNPVVGSFSGGSWNLSTPSLLYSTNNPTTYATVTSATVVPLPSALSLFVAAFGFLGWIRRKNIS